MSEIEEVYQLEMTPAELVLLWSILQAFSESKNFDLLFEFHTLKNKTGRLWDLLREHDIETS